MRNFRALGSAAAICGGVLALSGCHHAETSADGKALPAPQATQSAQAQIQQIENDPHIPASRKAAIEAQIVANNKNLGSKPPAKMP